MVSIIPSYIIRGFPEQFPVTFSGIFYDPIVHYFLEVVRVTKPLSMCGEDNFFLTVLRGVKGPESSSIKPPQIATVRTAIRH